MQSKFLFFLLLTILISCQKDIQNQFIQPPKYKGKNVREVFPYVKYTSVKTYSFNKFYTVPNDSTTQALIDSLDSISDVDYDTIYKRISYLTGQSFRKVNIIQNGKVSKNAILKQKLNRKEIQQFATFFYTEMVFVEWKNGKKKPKPHPVRECKPNYRDALVFFDGDKPVAWVNICFQCEQIKFTPDVKTKIYYYRMTWDKLYDYFQGLGHDVDYHDNWK